MLNQKLYIINLSIFYDIINELKEHIDYELIKFESKETFFEQYNENSISVEEILEASQITTWKDIELIAQLPSKSIIESGLIPNEVRWLVYFVDFDKGCFMGQEQTSRIKFRGRPRRLLKTLNSKTQVMEKI